MADHCSRCCTDPDGRQLTEDPPFGSWKTERVVIVFENAANPSNPPRTLRGTVTGWGNYPAPYCTIHLDNGHQPNRVVFLGPGVTIERVDPDQAEHPGLR